MLSQKPYLQIVFFPKKLSKMCRRQEHVVPDYTLFQLGVRTKARPAGPESQIQHLLCTTVIGLVP